MLKLWIDWLRNLQYSRTSIIRTSIIRNLDYPALQIACFNDIHCDFGVSHLEYLLQVCIRAIVLRLSGLFAYPDGFQHKGVQITEVLLYQLKVQVLTQQKFMLNLVSSCRMQLSTFLCLLWTIGQCGGDFFMPLMPLSGEMLCFLYSFFSPSQHVMEN